MANDARTWGVCPTGFDPNGLMCPRSSRQSTSRAGKLSRQDRGLGGRCRRWFRSGSIGRLDQAAQLFAISARQLIKLTAGARIVDIGRKRSGAVGRTARGNKTSRPYSRGTGKGFAHQSSAMQVQVIEEMPSP